MEMSDLPTRRGRPADESDALRESEAGLRRAQLMTKLAHVVTGPDGAFESWSETLPRLIGLDPERMPMNLRQWLDLVHPADRAQMRSQCIEAGKSGARSEAEYRVRHSDGTWIQLRQVFEPLHRNAEPGGKERWFNTIQDITEQKEQQERILRLGRIHAVLVGINSAIVRINERDALFQEACRVAVMKGGFQLAWIGMVDDASLDGEVVAWFGSEREVAGMIMFTARPDTPYSNRPASVAARSLLPVVGNDIDAGQWQDTDSGEWLRGSGAQSFAAFPLVIEQRAVAVMVLFADEVGFFREDELKLLNKLAEDLAFALRYMEKEAQLNYLAYYDALTGLANDSLFQDRLTQFLNTNKQGGRLVAVIAIDIDGFAHFNDFLGRHAADTLLVQIARRLGGSLRVPFSLARISGDNFAIAVSDLEQGADAAALLEQAVFAPLSHPFAQNGRHIRISVRAGLALFPDDGLNAETLFRHAEVALKKAKSSGERYLYYAPQMNAAVAARLALENELRHAMDARQFVMHYQPRVDLLSGRIVSAEALIRWQHPQRGLLAPSQFIPLAEETGLIVPIGAWVIDTVCAQQAAWLEQRIEIVPVSVNLSAVQLQKGRVLQTVSDALAAHRLGPQYIEFELTESAVMEEPEDAARQLIALKKMAIRLSLDDFGTGYSSLAYLKRFPFDFVKIDRTFIADVTTNPEDAAIATAVIAMAHSLNLRVVAEGVETAGQLQYLRNHHCDELQGYFFSPPEPADTFSAMLREGTHLSPEDNATECMNTVLIVDDEPFILSALNRLLRREGYRVLTAGSGEEGLELLGVNAVQVIVSDQRMSGMAGSEFLGIVKELYPDTIRIILSGYADLEAVTESVNRGAVFKFLTKPWDDELLRENIRDAFRRYRP